MEHLIQILPDRHNFPPYTTRIHLLLVPQYMARKEIRWVFCLGTQLRPHESERWVVGVQYVAVEPRYAGGLRREGGQGDEFSSRISMGGGGIEDAKEGVVVSVARPKENDIYVGYFGSVLEVAGYLLAVGRSVHGVAGDRGNIYDVGIGKTHEAEEWRVTDRSVDGFLSQIDQLRCDVVGGIPISHNDHTLRVRVRRHKSTLKRLNAKPFPRIRLALCIPLRV
jgi:hypothetical protein